PLRRSLASFRSVWRTASTSSARRRSFNSPIAHHYRIAEKLSVFSLSAYEVSAGGRSVFSRTASAGCGRDKIKCERQNRVDRHELQAFHPVALAIDDDDHGGEDREGNRRDLEWVEDQRDRLPDGERVEHQDRRHEERDLRAAADGDFDGECHLIAPRGDE